MSDFFIPFNHQPSLVNRTTGTYTVPAGKYARVTANYSISAQAIINGNTGFRVDAYSTAANGDVQNGSPFFLLKAGDAISFTSSGASGTATCPAGSGTNTGQAHSTSSDTTLTISINSSTAAIFRARAYASISIYRQEGGSLTAIGYATFSSSVSCTFVYEEYNVIS
jgi:hypothetical protein